MSADLGGFAWLDRTMLRVGARLAPVLPRVVMPLVVRRLRAEAAGVILPADDPAFGEHLARRRAEGVRCNVNILGEAILGDDEARRRLAQVLDRLERPDVDYVSVKISAISAPASARSASTPRSHGSCDALRAALRGRRTFDPPKFVNLDMEEYRDLDLTIAAFRRRARRARARRASTPASCSRRTFPTPTRVAELARRVGRPRDELAAGARIKVRIVKGANLAMEQVEAELHGWQLAPYDSKAEVDANYKAVLDVLLDPAFDRRRPRRPREPQPLRRRVGARSARRAARSRPTSPRRDRDARGHGSGAGRRRRDAAPATCCSTRPSSSAGDFAVGDRVPRAPARREHRARELPARICSTSPPTRRRSTTEQRGSPRPSALATTRERHVAAARLHASPTDGHRAADRRRRSRTRPTRDSTHRRRTGGGSPASLPSRDADVREHLRCTDDRRRRRGGRTLATAAGARLGSRHRRSSAPRSLHRVGDVFEAHRGRPSPRWRRRGQDRSPRATPKCQRRSTSLATTPRPRSLSTTSTACQTVTARSGRRRRRRGTSRSPSRPAVSLAALAAGNAVILKPAPQSRRDRRGSSPSCAGPPASTAMSLQFVPVPDDDDAGAGSITHPDVDAVILTGAYATAQLFLGWRPRSATARRDERQERASSSPRAADLDLAVARSRAVGVRPRRPEVLGREPRHRRGAALRRPRVPRPLARRRARACASGPADRPRHRRSDRSSIRPAKRSHRALTTLDLGERWLRRARGSVERRDAVDARRPARRRSWIVVPRAPSASAPCSA